MSRSVIVNLTNTMQKSAALLRQITSHPFRIAGTGILRPLAIVEVLGLIFKRSLDRRYRWVTEENTHFDNQCPIDYQKQGYERAGSKNLNNSISG